MSYDIYLESEPCVTCGHADDKYTDLNPTYNLTPIFDLALTGEPMPNPDVGEAAVVLFREKTDRPRGLRILSGRTGADSLRQLHTALRDLTDPSKAAAFRALEPANGWGDLDGARFVISKMIALANERPTATWKIQ